MFRIVAVCPKEYPGVSAVLRNGKSLGYWEFMHLGEEVPPNDLLLLGAWHPAYEDLLKKYKCVVYLTSTVAQMEFSVNSVELNQVECIRIHLAEKRIKAALSGWPDVVSMFPDAKSLYCPYPFDTRPYESFKAEQKILNSVGLFSTYEPRKNISNQLLAALNAGVELHTNLPLTGRFIFPYGWLPEAEYHRILSRLMASLHCGFAESFCYAAAEALLLGTLPIVSTQIAENLGLTNFLACHQCDSFINILMKIKMILPMNEREYNSILEVERENLLNRLKKYSEITKNVLDEIRKI